MVVGEVATTTDVLVVGGGPGGWTAALEAARLGRRVTLVERDRLGGVCLHVGCIPSKALVDVAATAHAARTGVERGITADVRVDLAVTGRWLQQVTAGLEAGVDRALRSAGVRVLEGTARFCAPGRVAVAPADGPAEHVEFDHAIVATGSRPAVLPVLPVDGERVVDSTGALALTRVPASVVLVGAGYVGVELGTALAKLGARTALVEQADRVLPGLPPVLGREAERGLARLGAEVLLDSRVEGLSATGVEVSTPSGSRVVEGELVVVAAGRVPNTGDLGLEVAGVPTAPGGLLAVDPARRAGGRLLAIGDVTPGPALAHKAAAEAAVAAATAAGRRARFDAVVPEVVFGDPELVSVGEPPGSPDSETLAVPVTAAGRARLQPGSAGRAVLVVDRGDGTVRGVHLAGPGVAELAGEAALAVELGATAADLALTVHAHPTMSELLGLAGRSGGPSVAGPGWSPDPPPGSRPGGA